MWRRNLSAAQSAAKLRMRTDCRCRRAKVTARNLGTSETREVTADAEGEYRFVELPAGEYEVSALAPGLQEARVTRVRVDVGAETVIGVALSQVKDRQDTVTVVETVPLVETSSTTLSQVVDRQLVQELPLNGRDFGKLVALTPGVTVEGSGVAGSEKGFGQFNINGNRDRSNNYNLDGTDNNDPFFNNSALNQVGITGAPATLLPLDAIQEFSIQSQFGSEYGRNSGAVVNIVTRSGTNVLHGSLYEYNRNSAFDARNYFNTALQGDGTPNPQSRFNNNNFGGSLGGPVIKDRAFFFFAYEGQRERVGSDFTLTVPSAAQIAAAADCGRDQLRASCAERQPGADQDHRPASHQRFELSGVFSARQKRRQQPDRQNRLPAQRQQLAKRPVRVRAE